MLVKLQDVMSMAQKDGFCVPAFNVYNMETVMGVISAAEKASAPVILQVYPRLINQESGYYLAPIILAAGRKARVPVCFHLDHGPSHAEMMKILRYGATGIMIDGSTYPFAQNVAMTRQAVELCSALDIGVEGEIGHIGSVNDDCMEEFTTPQEARDFAKQTAVTCLAVLVGNAHGHYKKPPKLDIDRIGDIRKATGDLPLVLHGGSGIPDDQVRLAIRNGIRKMNFGTDVCCSLLDGIRRQFEDPNSSVAIDLFMKKPIERVRDFALEKIALTQAEGRAK